MMREDRRYGPAREKPPESPETRREFPRDRDRILYSDALRRLVGVTQVAGSHEGRVFHHRLLHSLKVAQIARRLAERVLAEAQAGGPAASRISDAIHLLGGLDPDVAEAAALAHDLGHPPFGHIAEKELDDLVVDQSADGFEGNAQTFRILTSLGVRPEPERQGLDLTRATLRAVIKYPWPRKTKPGDGKPDKSTKQGKKWAAYRSEREAFDFAMALPVDAGGRADDYRARSLEAEVMDWADDVTYAIHDLDDFYRAGLIPLAELLDGSSELERFVEFASTQLEKPLKVVSDAWTRLRGRLPRFSYAGTRKHQRFVHGSTTDLIGRFLLAFQVGNGGGTPLVQIRDEARLGVDVLKQLTWRYVILRPGLATQQEGQKRIIRFLYEYYVGLLKRGGDARDLLPAGFQYLIDADPRPLDGQIAADIVASLTEQEAVMLYRRLTGHASGSVLDWLPS